MLSNLKQSLLLLILLRRRRRRRKRKIWVQRYFQQREEKSDFFSSLLASCMDNDLLYRINFCMSPVAMEDLLKLIGPQLTRKVTFFRQPIPEKERLAITLRYLATGDSQISLSDTFRIGRSTVCIIIREVCTILWNTLMPLYLQGPSVEKWETISTDFWHLKQFPNCLGAIDGRHVPFQTCSSNVTDRRSLSSITVLAIADAHCRLVHVDVRNIPESEQFNILSNSELQKGLESGLIATPTPAPLPGTSDIVPYVLVGNEVFPSNRHILRPYITKNWPTKKIFNYRLSRAHQVIENTFGVMASRWRILLQPITASAEKVEAIIRAVCVLHNFLLIREEHLTPTLQTYCPFNYVDQEDSDGKVIPGGWRADNNSLIYLRQQDSSVHSVSHSIVRKKFSNFFLSNLGEIAHQYTVNEDQ